MELTIEVISVVLNLIFLVFLLNEKKICWIFGILGSLTSIYLFYLTKLYSECILFTYYVAMGFYGFYLWDKNSKNGKVFKISNWNFTSHIYLVLLGILLSLSLGYCFDNFTNAEKSYLDAFTTIFSFIATYLEAKKVLSTWIFWIILNGLSTHIYFSQGLNIYALLALVYFIISFYGYVTWKEKFKRASKILP